ncbi:MAG: hypothetical protein IJ677_03325 [Alphaproteobacteria bacterium]|nr:hypothetical protein [Alphaproteobacteria bacterium]
MKKCFRNIIKYFTLETQPLLSSVVALFIVSFGVFYPTSVDAEYSLVQLRIANVLMNEMRGVAENNGEGDLAMQRVAEVMRNQYNDQHSRNSRITYSDILFHTWEPGKDSNYSGSRDKFANKSKADLERMGRNAGSSTDWNRALRLADQLVKGSLKSNLVRGANAFDASCGKDAYGGVKIGDSPNCLTPNYLMSKGKIAKPKNGQKYEVLAITRIDRSKKGSAAFKNAYFWNWELGNFHHAYDDDVVAPVDPNSNYSQSANGVAGSDSDGSRESGSCTMEAMQAMYLTDESKVDQYCWYCKIVIVLVNAYLQAASQALPATQSLGRIILKFGFLIWLAFYILQQVSSINAVTPGKMLQDILIMGFKVSLAYLAVTIGTQLLRDYYLDPIVGLGVDYGMAIFTGGGA